MPRFNKNTGVSEGDVIRGKSYFSSGGSFCQLRGDTYWGDGSQFRPGDKLNTDPTDPLYT